MRRNARLFAVMLGVGVAGVAWAAPKPKGAVGPHKYAVRTQKAVGPQVIVEYAVRTQKAVGPDVVPCCWAVRTQKAVGPDVEVRRAVRTEKAVGPQVIVEYAVKTQKAVVNDEKRAGQGPLLDLNAGF